MEHRILREMNYLIHAGAWSFFEMGQYEDKNKRPRPEPRRSLGATLARSWPPALGCHPPRSFNNYANRALDTLMYINGWASRQLAAYPANSLPIFSQTQDVGDNVAEIASRNDDVGHALMRSSKRGSQGCAVHSGCVGHVLKSRSDEIG